MINGILIWKEIKKINKTDDMTVYRGNLKELTKKFLKLINDYSKVAGYMANIQNSITFLYTSNDQVEFEIKNIISFTLALKKKYVGINLHDEN